MGLEISNTIVRIADLVTYKDPPVIDGLIATNVVFTGPAVLAILEGSIEFQGDTNVAGSFEGIFWPQEEGRTVLTGAIGLSNARFESCSFTGIGFAVSAKNAHQFASLINIT
ncbi:hypothetical protein [Microbacterium enclense]|uniref:hypothetical protein n=1 Tax=Microbacterium enclense TaxID=993073 RepID=UPI003D70CA86